MSTAALKKALHKAIDDITDDKILEAVYTILNKNKEEEFELSVAQKKELDKRLLAHKKGTLKYFSLEEVKSSANARLKKWIVK